MEYYEWLAKNDAFTDGVKIRLVIQKLKLQKLQLQNERDRKKSRRLCYNATTCKGCHSVMTNVKVDGRTS